MIRRTVFLLTLALYAWSASEMHEWVRVPRVVLHLIEHHSDLGHHDEDGAGHEHGDIPPADHDHSPFDDGCDDEFCACSGIAFVSMRSDIRLALTPVEQELCASEEQPRARSYSGSKWNPPKQG